MREKTVDVTDVWNRSNARYLKTRKNPHGAVVGWRWTVYLNNVPIMPLCATTWIEGSFNTDRWTKTENAILTLYRLQLHFFPFFSFGSDFSVFSFFFFKEMWKIKTYYKCIWICFEIVLRDVLKMSLKDIYMKHYSVSGTRNDGGWKLKKKKERRCTLCRTVDLKKCFYGTHFKNQSSYVYFFTQKSLPQPWQWRSKALGIQHSIKYSHT